MINTCKPTPTLKEKSWEYQQYYVGEKDKDGRRSGYGENNWSGAKSLEGYSGKFILNTMHGIGNYHWRHLGSENIFATYEGYFYCNRMHGYGVMSYPDGKTFQGLLCNNVRWGPGVESNAKAHQDVGIWRGTQLVRLTWRPDPPSIAPDLMTNPIGRTTVESHRILLSSKVETVGEVNRALELLKQSGADPRVAVDKWIKLYPKNCTDLSSPLCQTDVFERVYYDGKINSLQEVNKEILEDKLSQQIEKDVSQDVGTFYAWNNSNVLLNIMKHCFRHEKQRSTARIDLKGILSGPRSDFKPAGDHELNSRSLLMASYLGYVADVAELINKKNIHPDVADIQGNSAIMYAASGDSAEVIHFLVEAGANIDLCNDCCCTPLGVVLMRYNCAYNDISPSAMIQALFPPPATTITLPKLITAALEPTIFEWNINRDLSNPSPAGTLTKSPSKIARNIGSKKNKSLLSIKDQPVSKRKRDSVKVLDTVYDSDESLSDEKTSFNNINREYCIKISDVFSSSPISPTPVPYIFYLIDMAKEIDASEEEQKKAQDKNLKNASSKTMKNAIKTSKDLMWQNNEAQSIDSAKKLKIDLMSRIKQTILQLLSDGANPKLVQCPQPALYMAIMSNNSDLIRALTQYGADVNETYPQVLNYTPLDIAISRPYNADNLEVVHTLLACGADPCHRLIYDTKDPAIPDMIIPGPTLLHAVLARKVENVAEEDVCRRLLELLLQYDCDPLLLFKGSSAIDVAMNNNFDLLDIFVKSPKTCLNGKINNQNQSILVKMFSKTFFKTVGGGNRLQTFTNLLLFGADPLIECQNGEDIYPNIFVFAKKTLNEMEYTQGKPNSPPVSKPESKGKKTEKPKSKEKISTKSMVGKIGVDDIEDYRQALEQVTDCARSIHIRWLEARLVKELIQVIDRYKHRQWNMILKELGDTKSRGLWLTPQRCLEIWNLLSSTKKKIYNDQRVLRYLLCIVIFISWNNFGTLKASAKSYKKLTAVLKDAIEADVVRIIRQQNKNKELPEIKIWKLSYMKPELTKDVLKFNICFECALPLEPDKIVCCWCKLISFCSYECIKMNISRANCHPCSDFLQQKYFPNLTTTKNVL